MLPVVTLSLLGWVFIAFIYNSVVYQFICKLGIMLRQQYKSNHTEHTTRLPILKGSFSASVLVLLLSTHLVSSQYCILICMFAVLVHWWVEVLQTDRTTFNVCLWTAAEPRARVVATSNRFKPQVIYYWPFKGDASVVVYSNCNCL